MATPVLGLKTFAASDPVDYNEVNDNYIKIDGGVKTAMQGRAAQNLLDNSDFRNPVNQRGKSSYSTAGNEYTIDRWKTQYGTGLTIENGYINIIGQWQIYQVLKNPKDGVYTFAAEIRINSIGDNQPNMYISSGKECLLDAPIGQWKTYILQYDLSSIESDNISFSLCARGGNNSNASISARWAAMYKGSYTADTLPAYVPKGYAAELAECHRYYYQSWTGSIGANGIITRQAMALPRLASVELPCTMRTTPTITLYTSNGQAGAVKGWLDSVIVSGMTVVYANSKSFIPAHEGNGLTIGNWYGFHYTASADL